MRFFECLTVRDTICLARNRERAFYAVKSLGARIAIRVLSRLGCVPKVEKLAFGDVERVAGIREAAYRAAERAIDSLPGEAWSSALSSALGVDFRLILQKYMFDERYEAFEFIDMAARYAEEHPEESHELVVTSASRDFGAARKVSFGRFRVRKVGAYEPLGVLLLPLFVEMYWHRYGRSDPLRLDNHIVCEVDGEKIHEMFSSLFSEATERLAFVCEARNAAAVREIPNVQVLGLRSEGQRFLRRAVWRYLWETIRAWREVSGFSSHLFRVFYLVMRGRADAVDGTGNTYCTYEHLVPLKTVRNSFLRARGNRTVFVPANAHVTPQYFQSEIGIDYDVMCCAGPHIEELYRRKRAQIGAFLPTGSYDSHRMLLPSGEREERVARLRAVKGDALGILLISCGICDPTRRHEAKLMDLAKSLATLPGVKVFIRLKPVDPEPKYANFYTEALEGHDDITVTGREYDLFDFVGIADLVVTTISNAAFDLAQAGMQTMFVDYLGEPELHLCLAMTEGMPLPDDVALKRITDWITDADRSREIWTEVMRGFADSLAYKFPDFPSYRTNLLERLQDADIPVKPMKFGGRKARCEARE